MKRIMSFFICVMMAGILFAGCEKEEKVTKIIWQSDNVGSNEKYFNQVLKEKKLPYEVEFVWKGRHPKGQIVDIADNGKKYWNEIYQTPQENMGRELIPLDEYLNTEEGKVIKETYPEKVWDAYKVDGKQYTVLSMKYVYPGIVYIWDRELAEKYDVHPERWNQKIWTYEDELLRVYEGEKANENFITVRGLRLYSERMPGMTNVLGQAGPVLINEIIDDSEEIKAEFLYEMPEYQEYLQGAQSLYEKGIYRPEIEENVILEPEVFLTIDTNFVSKDAYLAKVEDDFWETHEVKEIGRNMICKINNPAVEIGITAESEHPKETFQFLCELYKDADLVNALIYGEEGKDYVLEEKKAVAPWKRSFSGGIAGNDFIAHPLIEQDVNKKVLYPKILQMTSSSKISGFLFLEEKCAEELEAVYRIHNEMDTITSTPEEGSYHRTGKEILYGNEEIIQQYKDAGIDKVVEEWNRQFQEWNEK